MLQISNLEYKYNNAVSFFHHQVEMGYIFNNIEFVSELAKLNYDPFTKLISKSNIKENKNYHETTFNQVTRNAIGLMSDILGPSVPTQEYFNILKMCAISKGEDPFECNYVELNGEKLLLFDRLDTYDSVACVGHEAMHYLQDKYLDLRNGYHQEVLSMLIEFIIADAMTAPDTDLLILNRNYAKTLNALKNLLIYIEECKQYEELIDYDKSYKIKVDQVKAHGQTMSYTYTSSFIYAYNLFLQYKDNPGTILRLIRRIFNEGSSVDRIINFYDLSLEQKETYEAPIKLIKGMNK